MNPEDQIITSWMDIILPYATDQIILGALAITWILVHYIKPYIRKYSEEKRKSIIRLSSFVICAGMILWWKNDDVYVYETAFVLGILNPLLYIFFIDKILMRLWPSAAQKLKNKVQKTEQVGK